MQAGRVALVTGGTRGIGEAVTARLAHAGVHVAAGFLSNREAADRLLGALAAKGCSLSIHQGDVADPGDCDRIVQEVIEQRGRVDFLVNNAGMTADATVRKMTIDDWKRVIETNLFGSFNMVKAVIGHMLERGFGRIVNIDSVIGHTGNIGQANYAASKAGLVGFTKSLALETARKGITVNCVAPGFIDTQMVRAVPPEVVENVIKRIPMQRLGQPWEVARLVCFLLEEESGYITGAVYAINGGLAM